MNWNSKLNVTFCNINNIIEKNKEHAATVHPTETQSLSTYFANQGSINKEIQVFFTSQTLVFLQIYSNRGPKCDIITLQMFLLEP